TLTYARSLHDALPISAVLTVTRVFPIIAAFTGLLTGIFSGRSVQTSAFWGIVSLFLSHLVLRVRSAEDLRQTGRLIFDALEDARSEEHTSELQSRENL